MPSQPSQQLPVHALHKQQVRAPQRRPLCPAGNHDGEADLNRREVVGLDTATGSNLSLTRAGPPWLSGAGNYWVDVQAPNNSVAARLWFLDSGNRGCNGGAASW